MAVDEEFSLDSEDTGESGREGYMLKEEHGKNCHVAVDEELSQDSEDASESGREGYMLKVEHGENCHG